ncbi:MAG: hypothetical protein RIR51_1290 [Bacteroidota bacterium]|jgi:hypothetical protein
MKFAYIALFLVSFQINAQSIGFDTGFSFASYYYKNSSGSNIDQFIPKIGSTIGISRYYPLPLINSQIKYGLRYQEMNGNGNKGFLDINYKASFASLNTSIEYTLTKKYFSYNCINKFSINPVVFLGLELGHLITGKQRMLSKVYDLRKEKEFNNFIVGPILGTGLRLDKQKNSIFTLDLALTDFINLYKKGEQLNFRRYYFTLGFQKKL